MLEIISKTKESLCVVRPIECIILENQLDYFFAASLFLSCFTLGLECLYLTSFLMHEVLKSWSFHKVHGTKLFAQDLILLLFGFVGVNKMGNLFSFNSDRNGVILKFFFGINLYTRDGIVVECKDLVNLSIFHNFFDDESNDESCKSHIDDERPFGLPFENSWVNAPLRLRPFNPFVRESCLLVKKTWLFANY